MKKRLATLALAAVPALMFSACNGGAGAGNAGIAPLPNAHQVSHPRASITSITARKISTPAARPSPRTLTISRTNPSDTTTRPQPPTGTRLDLLRRADERQRSTTA